MLPTALDPERLETAALVALVALVIGIFLTLRFIQKVAVRVVVLCILVAAGAAIWVQREDLSACRSIGSCTFFGQDVQVPTASNR